MIDTLKPLPSDLQAEVQAILAAGGQAEDVYNRLYAYYSALAEKTLAEAFSPQRAEWMERLTGQSDNIYALLAWLVERGEANRGLALAMQLEELWFEEAHTRAGLEWFERLLALPGEAVPPELRGHACDLAGALALNLSEYATARRLKEAGLAIFRVLDDPREIGFALLHIGHLVGFAEGDFAGAQQIYQEALEVLERAKSPVGIAHALADLGNVAIFQGEMTAAGLYIARSLRRYWDLDDPYNLAQSVRRAAGVAAGLGHAETAMRLAGAAAAHLGAIGVTSPAVFEQRYAQMLEPAQKALEPPVQEKLIGEGRLLTLEQAVHLALEELDQATDYFMTER